MAVAAPFLVAATLAAGVASGAGWKHLMTADGVVVSAREVPGQPFLEFRGVATVAANIFQVLAVLDDTSKHCDWQANCSVSKVLRRVDDFERYLYHRIDSPWPVSDRDVVLHATVEVDLPRRTVWSRFRAATLASHPAVDGVVRMPRLEGFFKLEALGPDSTRVTYQVAADTGGMLPTWLANRASRRLPHGTLVGMQRQTARFAGLYEAFHRRYNPEKGGKIPDRYGNSEVVKPAPQP